ncbi:MAG: hypothetical protein ABW034_11805 [Steroidobacteraceae bacterium]
MISRRCSRSKTIDLVAHVDREIAAGRLVPGRRLPEGHIARQLGMGRVHLSHYSHQVLDVLPVSELIRSARAYKAATAHLLRGNGDAAAAQFEPVLVEYMEKENRK